MNSTNNKNSNYTIVYKDRKEWYKNGKLHRENGPAIQYKNGFKKWYKNGILYRECGPKIIKHNKKWFINGQSLEYELSIVPKTSICSYCLNVIQTNFCFKTTNENYFHEKCLCFLICSK
jgi:hypothetical protein